MNSPALAFHWCSKLFLPLAMALSCAIASQTVFGLVPQAVAAETAVTEEQAQQARALFLEGTRLQLAGDIRGALGKYQESLKIQPDQKVEAQVQALVVKYPELAQLVDAGAAAVADEKAPEQAAKQTESVVPSPASETPPTASLPASQAQVTIPEPVIPAAFTAEPRPGDTFRQYQLVERLSAALQGGVVQASETQVYLNLGQVHGVTPGNKFEIVRLGAPVKSGNEVVGYEESKIATVEVSSVREKMSICAVVEKTGTPQVGDKVYQQKKKVKRLVVGQFSYNQGYNQLTKDMQEKLVTAFIGKGIQVVERDQLEKVLGELQLGYSGLVNADSAKKLGEMLSADSILLGTVGDLGNDLSINARMVDIESGSTFSAAEASLVKTPQITQLLAVPVEGGVQGAAPGGKKTGTGAKQATTQMQEMDGIEYVLDGCRKSGSTITCEFTITNRQEDTNVQCSPYGEYGTSLYDNFGNNYLAEWVYRRTTVTLANCTSDRGEGCTRLLLKDISTKASLSVQGIDEAATSVAKVSLGCASDRTKNFNSVTYRDIMLSE